jgi:SAM-dependent methyltransferase
MRMRSLLKAASLLKPSEFAMRIEACAVCGCRGQLRLRHDEIAVRCARCGASAITQSLVDVLARVCTDLGRLDVYELSAQGPLVRWLRAHAGSLATSEYFDGITPGTPHAGTVCQDVQHLTFADGSFDVCTSTEVFEHVEDDLAGFREIFRVLRPGGLHVFTVPLDPGARTQERTELRAGKRVSVLPPEFHADRFRGRNVFCYRNYGADIADRLAGAGFVDVAFRTPRQTLFGYARQVIVGRKPAPPARQP